MAYREVKPPLPKIMTWQFIPKKDTVVVTGGNHTYAKCLRSFSTVLFYWEKVHNHMGTKKKCFPFVFSTLNSVEMWPYLKIVTTNHNYICCNNFAIKCSFCFNVSETHGSTFSFLGPKPHK